MMASHVPPLGRATECPFEGMQDRALAETECHIRVHVSRTVDRESVPPGQAPSNIRVDNPHFPVVANRHVNAGGFESLAADL